MARCLLLERGAVVVRADLKADAGALRLRTWPQDHAVMVDRVRQIDRILVLGDKRQAENIGVIVGLLVDFGRLIGRMRNLANAYHVGYSSLKPWYVPVLM